MKSTDDGPLKRHVLPWVDSWGELYAGVLFLLYAGLLFLYSTPPGLADFGDWTYEAVLLKNHWLGVPDSLHILKHYPVPNSMVTIGVALLALVFHWQIAEKLWISLQLLISFFALRTMMRTITVSRVLWFIVPTAVFLNLDFWYGFLSFQLGVCWLIFLVALMLREEPRKWLFGVVLLLGFFSHMIPFAFSSLLLLLYVAQSRRFRLLWQFIPTAILSLWYLAGRFLIEGNADGHAGMLSPVRNYSPAFWLYKVNSYLKSFGYVNPYAANGSIASHLLGPRVIDALFLINGILCAAIGWCMIRAAVAAYRDKSPVRFAWTAILIVLPIYLLAPGSALGVSDPGARVLEVALAVGVFLCGAVSVPMRVAAVCSCLVAVVSVCLFAKVVIGPDVHFSGSPSLPGTVLKFGHVPSHSKDTYYDALERGDMRLRVFPTGLFLSSAHAEEPPKSF